MTDMIERVARAICREHCGNERHWRIFADDARAAIEAMREPTAEMCEAEPTNAYGDDGEWADHFRPSRGIWQGMIDAALSQSGEEADMNTGG